MSSGERFTRVAGIELCYETFGEKSQPALLLVMGLASQMVLWPDEFCLALADRGFRVIRFDNRDVGRSTILRDAPVPTRAQLLRRDPGSAAYSLSDMAGDAAGLLDALDVGAAHVVGASLGGMIAQLLAIEHPTRVLSLVSIMSTTGNHAVGRTDPRLYPRLFRRRPRDRADYVRDFIATYDAIGAKRYPPDAERRRATAERCFDRGVHPAGAARQLAAIVTTADRTRRLRQIAVPTTVIHGDADRLVMQSGGRATAAAISGAKLMIVPGMAHDLPPALWPQLIDAIASNADRARSRYRRSPLRKPNSTTTGQSH